MDLNLFTRSIFAPLTVRMMSPGRNPIRWAGLRGRNSKIMTPVIMVSIANLSPALDAELGIENGMSGVMLLKIKPGSTAARLGLRPRDIIREVNGKPIARVRDLDRISSRRQRNWRIILQRGGRDIGFEVSG